MATSRIQTMSRKVRELSDKVMEISERTGSAADMVSGGADKAINFLGTASRYYNMISKVGDAARKAGYAAKNTFLGSRMINGLSGRIEDYLQSNPLKDQRIRGYEDSVIGFLERNYLNILAGATIMSGGAFAYATCRNRRNN